MKQIHQGLNKQDISLIQTYSYWLLNRRYYPEEMEDKIKNLKRKSSESDYSIPLSYHRVNLNADPSQPTISNLQFGYSIINEPKQ